MHRRSPCILTFVVVTAVLSVGWAGSVGAQPETPKQEVRTVELGAKFKAAERLFAEKKYEEAAQKFRSLVREAPDHENAPKALTNAAVAHEKLRQYPAAVTLYEQLIREYPDSPLVAYATYRAAVNAERFFEYDAAISKYLRFFEQFSGPTPDVLETMAFRYEDTRPRALLSAAVLAAELERHGRAAELYETMADQFPNHSDAPSAQWQAVESWSRAGDREEMVEAVETYNGNYGAGSGRAEKVLEGLVRVGEYRAEQGDLQAARETYEKVIATFDESDLGPGSSAASHAAKAQFYLAEQAFREWDEIQIDGSLEEQKKAVQKKVDGQKEVGAAYKKVWSYENLEYTLAAGFRLGHLYEQFATTLRNVPNPFESGTDEHEMYAMRLADVAAPLEDKAVETYEKVYQKAREDGVHNEWTKRIVARLHHHQPEAYPLFKELKTANRPRLRSGRSYLAELAGESNGGHEELADAVALAREGKRQPALEKFRGLLDDSEVGALAAYNLGVAYERRGDDEKAANSYERALDGAPELSAALTNLVRLRLRQNRTDDAEELAEKYVEQADAPGLEAAKLEVGLYEKNYEKVSDAAKRILRDAPRDVDAMLALARANDGLGRTELVDSILERASRESAERADVYYLRGLAAKENGDTSGAKAHFENALEAQPHLAEAHTNLGLVHFEAGDYRGAAAQFQAALQDGDTPEAQLNLGCADLKSKQIEEAEKRFQALVERGDREAEAYFNLGILYLDEPMSDLEDDARLETSIEMFEAYRERIDRELGENAPALQYIQSARRKIDARD